MEGDEAVPACSETCNGLVGNRVVLGNPYLKPAPISSLKQNGFLQALATGASVASTDAQCESEEVDSELERAQQEWDALESIHPVPVEDLTPSTLISFNEALQHFQTTDLGDLLKNIRPTVHRTGLAAFSHFLFGPPRLQRELMGERDLLFAMAQCSFDNTQPVHVRVLQTIYRKLTCSPADCPRYGPHWENIGFQGTDPATDLRGTGFLALMHMLYLVMDPDTLTLTRNIYRLSQHPVQNFPFSVMSINMTRIVLHVLREEVLSKECNRRRQVVGVVNDFYLATFLHLYQLWKHQKKTITDSGYVLKDVELYAKKNPKQLLRRLHSFLQERRGVNVQPKSAETPLHTGGKGARMNFTGVCELPPEMEGEARLI